MVGVTIVIPFDIMTPSTYNLTYTCEHSSRFIKRLSLQLSSLSIRHFPTIFIRGIVSETIIQIGLNSLSNR